MLELKQSLLSIISILSPQDPLSKLPEPVFARLLSIPCVSFDLLCMHFLTRRRDLVDTLFSSPWPNVEKVLKPLISSLVERSVPPLIYGFTFIDQLLHRSPTSNELAVLRQLLFSPNLTCGLLEHGCSTLVASVFGNSEGGPLQELLSEFYQRHPLEVRTAIKKHAEENEENGKDEDDLIASLSLVS